MNWLIKEEPRSYSFDELSAEGRTRWSGVKNPLAQQHLRAVRRGDRILYYHTGQERAVVGVARAASAPYPDPDDRTGRRVAIDVEPVRRLRRPVALAEMRGRAAFADFALVRIPRLSVMPVSDRQWREIERMAGEHDRSAARRPRRGKTLIAALAIAAAAIAPSAPLASDPLSAGDLDRILGRADRSLGKAENAVRGSDPGRVSLLLQRVDEEMAQFESGSRLADLEAALESGRASADGGDLQGAAEAVRRARVVLPALSDYTETRQAEIESRGALRAAGANDADGYLAALERFETAVMPGVLVTRITEVREAIARARAAMVRRDMEAGRLEVDAARRALAGLRLAGALSRSLFSLRIGSEMMDDSALLAARDHLNRALRSLSTAIEFAPEDLRDDLDAARARVQAIRKRLGKPQDGDLDALREITGVIERTREALDDDPGLASIPVRGAPAAAWPGAGPVPE